jgi:hypothetical protein
MSSVTISRDKRRAVAEASKSRLFAYLNLPNAASVEQIRHVGQLLQLLVLAEAQRRYLHHVTEKWLFKKKLSVGVEYHEGLPFFLSALQFTDPELRKHKGIFDELLIDLNAKLSRYHWTPIVRALDFAPFAQEQVWPGLPLEERGLFFPSPSDLIRHIPNSGLRIVKHARKKKVISDLAKLNNWENWAAQFLLFQLQRGMIFYFRKCLSCHDWFFAITDRQQFCSDRCRKKHASQSETFKARRRSYMREYRKQELERAKRAKTLARSHHEK